MKKFLALLLSLTMVLSLSVTAFAADISSTDEGKNSTSTDVKGNYKLTYVVAISTDGNGTVTVKDANGNEKTNFAAGETVTLTVTPNEGYTLADLTVKDASDSPVEVSETNTFTMPASNVTVTATFKEGSAEIAGMTVTVTGEKSYDDATKTYTVGDDATITITVSGKKFNKLNAANVIKYGNTTVVVTEKMTVDATSNKATLTLKGSDLKDMGVVVFSYTNNYSTDGTDTTWTDCETKVQYQAPTISVGVSWGSMSFTYSDVKNEAGVEAGWSCEDGANKVTVANNSEIAVSAAVKYVPEAAYGINGSFDISSANVEPNASKEFKLSLSSKPSTELTDVKIGTVTVTIAEEVAVLVDNEADLKTALDAGGLVKLGEDLTLTETLYVYETANPAVLDLNGHTLSTTSNRTTSFFTLRIVENANMTLTDSSKEQTGKIAGYIENSGSILNLGTLTITGGTIENTANGTGEAVYTRNGTTNVTGGTLKAYTAMGSTDNSTVNISGGTFISIGSSNALSVFGRDVTASVSGGTFNGDISFGGSSWLLESTLTVSGNPSIPDTSYIEFEVGTLDLSGMTNPDGLKVKIKRNDSWTISENLLLPDGYTLYDAGGNAVTTNTPANGTYTLKPTTT